MINKPQIDRLHVNGITPTAFDYKIDNPIIGSDLDPLNSLRSIQKAIVNFFRLADVGNTLIFYFSGHGIPRQDDEEFLATPEVDPNEPMLGGIRCYNIHVTIFISNRVYFVHSQIVTTLTLPKISHTPSLHDNGSIQQTWQVCAMSIRPPQLVLVNVYC